MTALDSFRLDGRAALVTGAGRGIGAASALALADAGASVALVARSRGELEEVAAAVRNRGGEAVTLPADLGGTDAGAVEQAAEGAVAAGLAELGRLDVVVNNVGGARPKPLPAVSASHLEAAFRFNVTTAHAVTRAALPALREAAGGEPDAGAATVVNVASMAGRMAGRGSLAYGTAKAALVHWTRIAARDLAPDVRVNAVAPGAIETSALATVVKDDDLRAAMERGTPLGRLGRPEEVAALVLYLASPASAFVTGKVVEIDGGAEHQLLG